LDFETVSLSDVDFEIYGGSGFRTIDFDHLL